MAGALCVVGLFCCSHLRAGVCVRSSAQERSFEKMATKIAGGWQSPCEMIRGAAFTRSLACSRCKCQVLVPFFIRWCWTNEIPQIAMTQLLIYIGAGEPVALSPPFYSMRDWAGLFLQEESGLVIFSGRHQHMWWVQWALVVSNDPVLGSISCFFLKREDIGCSQSAENPIGGLFANDMGRAARDARHSLPSSISEDWTTK